MYDEVGSCLFQAPGRIPPAYNIVKVIQLNEFTEILIQNLETIKIMKFLKGF